MKEIFIPIKKDNIVHYFGTGIIKARAYFKTDHICDIQNLCPNNIIALKNKELPQNSDCLIAVLVEDEFVQDSENIIIIKEAIPISRINKIYIKDIDNIDRLISNANMATNTVGGGAIIHKEIFEKLNIEQINLTIPIHLPNSKDENLAIKLDKFNRIMGAMAFISHKENNNLNKTLFDILSILNKDIATEYKKITNFKPNLEIIPIKKLDLSNYEILNFKDCKNKLDAKNISAGIKDKFEVPMDKFKLHDTDTGLKILYDLFKASDPISSEKIKNMNNDTLFLYGYNKGYDGLRTFYEKKKVKFDINSFIGRVIIEIIYQYAIKDKDNIDILFLDKYKQNSKSRMEDDKDYYLFDSSRPFSIYDFIDEYKMNFYQNDTYLAKYIEEDKNLSKNLNELDNIKNQNLEKISNGIEEIIKRCAEYEQKINQLKKENIILRQKFANINQNDILTNSDNLDRNYIMDNNHIETIQDKKDNLINEINEILSKLDSKPSKSKRKIDYENACNDIRKIISKDKGLLDYESTN
ncbi:MULTISPECIES: hypothetical protein [Campylobacter]|uniref:hypothetical protein n=1 Tax=Campylobacter TaxID=194 RepID=UPI000A3580CF|nr:MULTISPECIES: hypothetical protein [unclassified Campylobacter]